MQGVETLYNCSTFMFAHSQCLSKHFFACPSFVAGRGCVFLLLNHPNQGTFQEFLRRSMIRSCFCPLRRGFFRLALAWSASRVNFIPGIVQAFSRSTCFHQSFPHGVQIALLPCHLDVVHVNGEHGSLLSMNKGTFPSGRCLPSVFKQDSKCNPARRCPYSWSTQVERRVWEANHDACGTV